MASAVEKIASPSCRWTTSPFFAFVRRRFRLAKSCKATATFGFLWLFRKHVLCHFLSPERVPGRPAFQRLPEGANPLTSYRIESSLLYQRALVLAGVLGYADVHRIVENVLELLQELVVISCPPQDEPTREDVAHLLDYFVHCANGDESPDRWGCRELNADASAEISEVWLKKGSDRAGEEDEDEDEGDASERGPRCGCILTSTRLDLLRKVLLKTRADERYGKGSASYGAAEETVRSMGEGATIFGLLEIAVAAWSSDCCVGGEGPPLPKGQENLPTLQPVVMMETGELVNLIPCPVDPESCEVWADPPVSEDGDERRDVPREDRAVLEGIYLEKAMKNWYTQARRDRLAGYNAYAPKSIERILEWSLYIPNTVAPWDLIVYMLKVVQRHSCRARR
jgi:hypothetical protein